MIRFSPRLLRALDLLEDEQAKEEEQDAPPTAH